MMRTPVPENISPPRNLRMACEIVGLSLEDACSFKRTRGISYRRFHVMTIMRSWGRSLPQIGRLLGGMDHTSVLHGIRRWEEIKDQPLPPIRPVPTPRPPRPIEKYIQWKAKRAVWEVCISKRENGYIGTFSDYDEAVAARDSALSSTPINEEAA